MNFLVTVNKLFKQMGILYVEIYKEIVKMVKENIHRVMRSVLIGIGAFAICFGVILVGLFITDVHSKYVFSIDNWNKYPSHRIKMVNSMEAQHDFTGMSREQVEKLLGKPSYKTSKEDCEYKSLEKKEFDTLAQYELNKKSRSIIDMIDKNYVVAYKSGKVVYTDVLIAD